MSTQQRNGRNLAEAAWRRMRALHYYDVGLGAHRQESHAQAACIELLKRQLDAYLRFPLTFLFLPPTRPRCPQQWPHRQRQSPPLRLLPSSPS